MWLNTWTCPRLWCQCCKNLRISSVFPRWSSRALTPFYIGLHYSNCDCNYSWLVEGCSRYWSVFFWWHSSWFCYYASINFFPLKYYRISWSRCFKLRILSKDNEATYDLYGLPGIKCCVGSFDGKYTKPPWKPCRNDRVGSRNTRKKRVFNNRFTSVINMVIIVVPNTAIVTSIFALV